MVRRQQGEHHERTDSSSARRRSLGPTEALSLVIGAGWALHQERHVSFDLFGAQHAAALGDLHTVGGQVQDVLTSFWSAGIAIVVA